MSSLESREDIIKPLIIKVSKIATISISAYILAKFISKRSDSIHEPSSIQSPKNPKENEPIEDDEVCNDESSLGSKLLELESQVDDLQINELSMESRYLRYRAMKEKEITLTEIRNQMLLEKTRAEFLLKEICLAEEHNKFIGNLVINFIKFYERFRVLKEENLLFKKNVRKLCRRSVHRSMIIWKQNRLIELKNIELTGNERDIKKMYGFINEIGDENKELKEVLDHLQREKIELTNKVGLVEQSYASITKVEITESVTKEEYERVLKELEQLKQQRETEANETTYLKWSNACLRHELQKYHEQQEHNKDDNNENQIVVSGPRDHKNENNNVTSKRRRFMMKIKKWVDGDDEKDNKNDIKCFGKNIVSEEEEDLFVHARMSCSSV